MNTRTDNVQTENFSVKAGYVQAIGSTEYTVTDNGSRGEPHRGIKNGPLGTY
jgi:hypothetical protein